MKNNKIFILCILYSWIKINETTSYGSNHIMKETANDIPDIRNRIKLLSANFFYDSIICRRILYLGFHRYYSISNWIKINQTKMRNTKTIKSIFNDPGLINEWYYLEMNSDPLLSHELERLWKVQIYGEGVFVAIVGDGIDTNHQDLAFNHEETLSYNFINNSRTIEISRNSFLTAFAGLIAAVGNNSICGVGGAPSAKFSNLQIYRDNFYYSDDDRTARSIGYKNGFFDIYSLIFRINIYDESILNVGPLTINALEFGFTHGRSNLGNLFIMGAGEDGFSGNNCAFNGLSQRIETLTIGAIYNNGNETYYTEKCVSILAATLSSKNFMPEQLLYSTGVEDMCKNTAGGIGASVSIASSIYALLISTNGFLNVRQIVISTILSSSQIDRSSIRNGAGYYYSYSSGFGMINASELIITSMTSQIKHLKDQHICKTHGFISKRKLKKNRLSRFRIYTNGCLDKKCCVTNIENVFLVFTIKTKSRNSISINITSPMKSKFEVLKPRKFDTSQEGFNCYQLKMLCFFGENPYGHWVVEIYSSNFNSQLHRLQLKFYGTCNHPIEAIKNYFKAKSKGGSNTSTPSIEPTKTPSFTSLDSPVGIDTISFRETLT